MPADRAGSYNDDMTTDTHLTPASQLLDALAVQDFDRMRDALDDDATMSALLPRGPHDWTGAAEISSAFQRWFGDTGSFEVADASIGRIGGLVELRWRLRLQAERLGDAPMVVEQHVFATAGPNGRIAHLALLCSGFWPSEQPAA